MQYCSCITNSEKNNTPKPLECFFVKRQNSAIVGFYFITFALLIMLQTSLFYPLQVQ